MKRASKFRFYPTDAQAAELSRTFGRVRLVCNKALAARSDAWPMGRERVTYNATSAILTAWKESEELAFLCEVSCVPLQQALRHQKTAADLLEYKCDWYGRELITADRWFPSSKLCSACGTIRDDIPLNVREWTCRCGAVHDRDVNAAPNLLAAGLAVAACGDGVRPQRITPGGQSSMKQEVVPPQRQRAAAQPRG
ncbi:zinc ribbon domain-containing protein [Kitasatospora sp. NPDC059648]|uniref:zinc ribbon domain-containing protein n=1 Tax=Kitasatospora sp. NPDC059648 TaxID=3346894 RepID=UPI0036A4ED00